MPLRREARFYRTFILSSSLAVVLILSLISYFMYSRTDHLLREQNLIEARALFNSVAISRTWNSSYGGVYVEKRPGVESSPFIEAPDIRTADGRVFTVRNHAIMAREMSLYSEREGLFRFRIAGMRPLNPGNKPDVFEERALRLFVKGQREVSETYSQEGKRYFRYMAPLLVSEDCLRCHGRQGYRTGDVIGGVSISFETGRIFRELRANALLIFSITALATSLLMGLIYLFSRRLMTKTSEVIRDMERMVSIDELTGLFNRKYILMLFSEEFERAKSQGRGLACIILNINNFREVNDRYGHLFGDELLRRIAAVMKGIIRETDLLGRYGGPEFLVILPDTDREAARTLALRLRTGIRDESAKEIPLSVSICLTTLRDEDRYIDDLIKRVDEMIRSQVCTERESCECV